MHWHAFEVRANFGELIYKQFLVPAEIISSGAH